MDVFEGLIERYEKRDLIPICIRCRKIYHNGTWLEIEKEYDNYTGSLCGICFDFAKEFNRNMRLKKCLD